jgi:D-3-phosphoglycerate dehydrogenase
LQHSDIVSLHARGSKPIMGADQFAAMRRGSYFINTAREQRVDERALHEALVQGHLAGAALDVVEDGSPLLALDQVVVTPHIGGATHETLRRGAAMAGAAIEALIDGRVPPYLVNPEILEAGRPSAAERRRASARTGRAGDVAARHGGKTAR